MTWVWAFDLDGVLAEGPPPSPTKWGRMKGPERQAHLDGLLYHYSRAARLYTPPGQGPFHVITARKERPEVRAVTEQWLHEQFRGRVASLHMLNQPRRVDVVVPFKAAALAALGATDFMEDNPAVVKGLRLVCPEVHVWLYRAGVITADPARHPSTR